MKKTLLAAMALWGGLVASAQILTPTIQEDFQQRVKEVNNPAYFTVFDRELTPEQREALEVLYAYMPLPDIADNSADFFLENVNASLKARAEMPWGQTVPMREWRHFVLPIRINDEALDGHRALFYDELKDRVKGMSMEEAILEVNHWCHEKATYQPSDGRTHSPLATVYTAIGRCGEESTFTVAALRALGIPARQIYTPRWAHTDDNHAWVEAWADGKWYFLGACEPEAVLNLGWFNAPASRGMLMNARTFGNYDGPEEVLQRLKGYTDINVTENYAPTDTIHVVVVDKAGQPVADAQVSYRLYNYAEFYPIVTKEADAQGRSSLVTGLGDLLIWATDGKEFGATKASVGKDQEVTVTLEYTEPQMALEWDIVPPPPSANAVVVEPRAAALCDLRKIQEDSIRGLYTASFLTPEQTKRWAGILGVDEDRYLAIMTDARANHQVINEFMRELKPIDRERGMRLLEGISQKDRSDVPLNVLQDHMLAMAIPGSLTDEYILNPRVANEALTTYRSYFMRQIAPEQREAYRQDPQKWVEWVADSIALCEPWLPVRVRMSPQAVWESRVTNEPSRNIFFVASARSMGIPARIDPITGKTQWANDQGQWVDAQFETPNEVASAPQGTLKLDFTRVGRLEDPKYYSQFTISKIVDGEPMLLNYPEEATWASTFKDGEKLDAGEYMLVTGQRMANGGVLARAEFFTIEPDKTVELPLTIRQDEKGVQVIGNLDAETIYHDLATGTDKSILSTTGRGYYVLGLITPNHEPSNHTLRDIAIFNDDFNQWGRPVLLLFKDEDAAARYDASQLPALPDNVHYGIDKDGAIAAALTEALNLPSADRPVFVIADTFNRVVFLSQGYTIGLGEQLIDTIHQIKE